LLPDLNLCELEMLVPFRMHIRHIVSLYLNQHDMWFPDSRPRVPRLFRVRCRGSAPIATRVRLRALSGHALFTISDETFSDCLHAVSSLTECRVGRETSRDRGGEWDKHESAPWRTWQLAHATPKPLIMERISLYHGRFLCECVHWPHCGICAHTNEESSNVPVCPSASGSVGNS
jgi:hypothetical protein